VSKNRRVIFETGEFLAHQLAQKFAFVHAVLEGLTAIDKDDWHLIVELAAKFSVAIYIHLPPGKSAAARELAEALLHDFAEMTAFPRVDDDLARLLHAWIVPLK
jgi:hypothetical protein